MAEQLGFAEAFVDRRVGSNAKLAKIDELIDWSRLAVLVAPVRSGETGRPGYTALAMLKALYLQALYDLSDPGLEEALLDRLSFRRFCGFTVDAATPDETTICRFRGAVAALGILQACFGEVPRQLEAKGVILKKGTLMDALIVAAGTTRRRARSAWVQAIRASLLRTGPTRTANPFSAISCMSGSTSTAASSVAPYSPRLASPTAPSPRR